MDFGGTGHAENVWVCFSIFSDRLTNWHWRTSHSCNINQLVWPWGLLRACLASPWRNPLPILSVFFIYLIFLYFQLELVWTITNVTSGNSEHTASVVNAGGIVALIGLLSLGSNGPSYVTVVEHVGPCFMFAIQSTLFKHEHFVQYLKISKVLPWCMH